MKLEVRLLSGIEKKAQLPFSVKAGEGFALEVNDGATLGEFIREYLNIELKHAPIGLVNGQRERESYVFKENDRVAITMPFGGEYKAITTGVLWGHVKDR